MAAAPLRSSPNYPDLKAPGRRDPRGLSGTDRTKLIKPGKQTVPGPQAPPVKGRKRGTRSFLRPGPGDGRSSLLPRLCPPGAVPPESGAGGCWAGRGPAGSAGPPRAARSPETPDPRRLRRVRTPCWRKLTPLAPTFSL